MNFKNYIKNIRIVFILLFIIPTVAFAEQTVSVKKDNVNVRTGPGTNFPVYMELFKGYPLKVLQQKGDWLQISDFENDKGWIYSKLVTSGNTVIANGTTTINMRTKATTDSAIIATVDRGVVLTKLSAKEKWTKVKHSQGTIGWIYSALLWP